jgi:hypothetical protein
MYVTGEAFTCGRALIACLTFMIDQYVATFDGYVSN